MEADYEETSAGHKYEVQRPLKRETQLAIWICLGTLCRIGELLMTRWEDLDLVERYWNIPVANVKGPMGKKQSLQVGDRQFQFKTRKDLSRRANDNALVLKSGSHREWTPHDMRRTGATMMQTPDIIDRCQNHEMAGSRVRRHYLHHEFADERKAVRDKRGQRIDAILAPTTAT